MSHCWEFFRVFHKISFRDLLDASCSVCMPYDEISFTESQSSECLNTHYCNKRSLIAERQLYHKSLCSFEPITTMHLCVCVYSVCMFCVCVFGCTVNRYQNMKCSCLLNNNFTFRTLSFRNTYTSILSG